MSLHLTLRDLASMRLPLAVLAIVLIISAVLIRITSGQHATAEVQRQAQAAALEDARVRFQRSGEEREALLRYLPAYQQLERDGFVGSEQRIDWIESLRAANKQAGLFGVSYQMDVRKPFDLVGHVNAMSPQLRHSEAKLTFGLMHEGDLMRFLDMLEGQHTGMFMVTACSIDRTGFPETPAPRQANLNAQCNVSWLTIEPRKAGT
jgi:hypothetical protein